MLPTVKLQEDAASIVTPSSDGTFVIADHAATFVIADHAATESESERMIQRATNEGN